MSFDEWNLIKLDDLLVKRNQGVNTTTEKVKYTESGIPVIRAQNITSFGLDFTELTYVSEDTFKRVRIECKPKINDVLFTNIGSQFGTACKVKTEFPFLIAWNVLRLQTNNDILPDFLVHYLNNPNTRAFIRSLNSSSTMPFVSGSIIGSIKLNIPPLKIQNRIASILCSLDDKIELNRQMNQTLEAVAQALFKEWFVDFNFPGATGEMRDSELGEIPKGWKVGKLGQVYKTTSGGTPSRSKPEYYEGGTIPWIKSKELNNSFITETEEQITEGALKNSSAKILPKHSVLVAMYGATVGEIGITSMNATCNQAICAFLHNENYPYTFIYHFLKLNKADIISRAVGSAQQNISQDLLKKIDVLLPPRELLQRYHKVVGTLFQKVENSIFQIQTLTQLRDTLLPKLMKGEIDVFQAETQTAAAI